MSLRRLLHLGVCSSFYLVCGSSTLLNYGSSAEFPANAVQAALKLRGQQLLQTAASDPADEASQSRYPSSRDCTWQCRHPVCDAEKTKTGCRQAIFNEGVYCQWMYENEQSHPASASYEDKQVGKCMKVGSYRIGLIIGGVLFLPLALSCCFCIKR
eukprot:gnl/TRDRNA2_/TRDRNA2_40641_c0_seq2.p1 gnl/TRDRNA2_/TRDRNA2_40641_c0~~gnl/TRDRNA2_/TRDRNA2_40641_c0_seq2.p1  ORF type:complete len:156 (+),score=23.34 gnl/TRDRNA2_/TRDRNA2_40641_c0_seq2:24-491(+)